MNRIRLGNTVFEGLNNTYLFAGDGPTTLVDTGVATTEARDELTAGLDDAGVAVDDLEQILLTHWHGDHAGLASELQAESGAVVRVHAADAPLVERDPDVLADLQAHRDRLFDEWGMPPDAQAELRAFIDSSEDVEGGRASVEAFEGDESFPAGGETLTAMHLPGHTSGLTGFVRETDGGRELLSGDAILPVYTPNVGGADVRVDRPLASYLDTLVWIEAAEFSRAWPGHRDPIDDPAGRAREIIDHHGERMERVLGVLHEQGPADAWTVSAALFGDLSAIHILHGPGEAYAHLEHLRAHGVVERTADGFVATDQGPPLSDLIPGADD